MPVINNAELEHLSPPFKVEIAPHQQTETNQVSKAKRKGVCLAVRCLWALLSPVFFLLNTHNFLFTTVDRRPITVQKQSKLHFFNFLQAPLSLFLSFSTFGFAVPFILFLEINT